MSHPSHPRTRFAPSPTGSLHVGGARTALYCLLYARKHEGRFVLRIEDTDQTRSSEESTRGILEDLKWLGLHWDEGPEKEGNSEYGPYFQSQRLDLYNQYIEGLLTSGKAYLAWDTREELGQMRKIAQKEKRAFRYRGEEKSPQEIVEYQAEGRIPVVRLNSPHTPVTVQDEILGDVTVGGEDLDDLVIRKADGYPTYHFAVVVDDHLMEVTQVLRGQEHLMNTHKHLCLYKALDWAPPAFGHMPLIFNPSGSKMSKRDKAKAAREAARQAHVSESHPKGEWGWLANRSQCSTDEVTAFMTKKTDEISIAERIADALDLTLPMIEVMDFRKAGYIPEALLNYLALLGWSPGDDREHFTLDEMIQAFSLDRVNNTAARFDPKKLRWMNGEYQRSLPMDRLMELVGQYLAVSPGSLSKTTPDQLRQIVEMCRERTHTFGELAENAEFFFHAPTHYQPKAVKKHILKDDGLEKLQQVREVLGGLQSWTKEAIENALNQLVTEGDTSLGKYAQPIRIALSGAPITPPIFDTIAFLSQEDVVERMNTCINALANHHQET